MIGLSLLPSPHPEAFQRLLVRSSIPCYRDFNLDKGRSLGFASASADSAPFSDSLSLRLRGSRPLTSPATATRRIIMQKARRHTKKKGAPTACRRTVSGSVSLLCPRFFSPFPHGTSALSVSRMYLALPHGPGGFTQDSSCPALLRIPLRGTHATRTGLSPSAAALSGAFRSHVSLRRRGPTTPAPPRRRRFGLLPVRSPLLGESFAYFLFLRVLRCFSSPRMPSAIKRSAGASPRRVVPFGDPRINGRLRLPADYRSLPRPSSPARAKASPVRPFFLSRPAH